MGRWSSWNYPYFPRTQPKRVENGIKLKSQRGQIGAQWWSRRWVEVLESFRMGARFDRGKSYARQGQVVSVDIAPGNVTAKVQGSSSSPYRISIELKPLSSAEWDAAIRAMASQAKYAAKLLAGEMPQDIEDAFRETKIPLFPQSKRDLKTDCSCPDSANPCKHIAAVYFILAEKFDEDPFVLFTLRGMPKNALITKIRESRVREASGAPPPDPKRKRGTTHAAKLPDQEHPAKETPHIPAQFWAGTWQPPKGDLARPVVQNAVLKRLGPSPFTLGRVNVSAILERMYDHLSEVVNELVAGGHGNTEGQEQ